MAARRVLVHYHIFKNAGTSVDVALQRSFGARWAPFEGSDAHDTQSSEQLGAFLESRPDVVAVSSHLARPPLPFPGCRPIVLLRHPLLRARSVYQFTRKDESQHASGIARGGDFAGYVRWALEHGRDEGGVVIRDYQVIHLSQASFRGHILQAHANPADLDEVKELLESWGIFGIVEGYAHSARRFQRAFALDTPELDFTDVWANRTRSEPPNIARQTSAIAEELGGELFERLVEANRLDLALYDWAVGALGHW